MRRHNTSHHKCIPTPAAQRSEELKTDRSVDVLLYEDVHDGKDEVGQQLPDLPSQHHPQDMVWGFQADPAPAHRHLRGVIADLVQADSRGCDREGHAPAAPARGQGDGRNGGGHRNGSASIASICSFLSSHTFRFANFWLCIRDKSTHTFTCM